MGRAARAGSGAAEEETGAGGEARAGEVAAGGATEGAGWAGEARAVGVQAAAMGRAGSRC